MIALPTIRQITATELKAMRDRGDVFELIDVRTPGEREVACIEGSVHLDEACHDELLTRDRATRLVFLCHHGFRSQGAAEYFQERGFVNLFNVSGGIEAWSCFVDPAVPRY